MDDVTNLPQDDFYSDDVEAQALADNGGDPDKLNVNSDIPVTSGEMEIGDLDSDPELDGGSSESYDEESVAGSDN